MAPARRDLLDPRKARRDIELAGVVIAPCDDRAVGLQGRAGFIVPAGIATDDTTKDFFRRAVSTRNLASIYLFDYRSKVFPDVSKHYALRTLGTTGITDGTFEATAQLMSLAQFYDPRRRYRLSLDDIHLCNPNTRTMPVPWNKWDADLLRFLYQRVPVLVNESTGANPWGIRYQQGHFNMSSDSKLFHDSPELGDLPLCEAKMFHQFDHRWATFAGVDEGTASDEVGEPDIDGEEGEEGGDKTATRDCSLAENRTRTSCPPRATG